jgi:hypothetical protein
MHLSWFIRLDQVHSSYLVLMSLATAAVAGGVLLRLGLLGPALRGLGFVVGTSIRQGFLLWERLLSWASWLRFLVIVLAFLAAGVWAGGLEVSTVTGEEIVVFTLAEAPALRDARPK